MTGLCRLSEPTLGDLDMTCGSGYVVTAVDVGTAAARPVVRDRALADGTEDDSSFLGARAVSVTFTIDQRVADAQLLLDAVDAYQDPRLRPSLTYSMPGSAEQRTVRRLSPRGLPIHFDRPKALPFVAQWVCADGRIVDPVPTCIKLTLQNDVEPGRTYPEVYNVDGGRGPYPFSPGVGGKRVLNRGTRAADWTGTIYGPCVNPALLVNGVNVAFTNNGGQTLVAGETLTIDTAVRTIVMNGDATLSRFAKTNYPDWSWQSLRLPRGYSVARLSAASGAPTALFCTTSTW